MIEGSWPLLGRHRADDGLETVELLLVHVQVAELRAHARHHLEQRAQRTILRTCCICSRKSSSVNCSWRIFFSSVRAALVDLTLGLLDQGHHVAHAEDALGHAVGVEALEVTELLPVDA